MAVFDLRTIYSGKIEVTRKELKDINRISRQVHDNIKEVFLAFLENREQDYVRQKIAELAVHEAELSSLETEMLGSNTDSIVIEKVKMTLSAVRRAQQRLERILSSLQNEANNAT